MEGKATLPAQERSPFNRQGYRALWRRRRGQAIGASQRQTCLAGLGGSAELAVLENLGGVGQSCPCRTAVLPANQGRWRGISINLHCVRMHKVLFCGCSGKTGCRLARCAMRRARNASVEGVLGWLISKILPEPAPVDLFSAFVGRYPRYLAFLLTWVRGCPGCALSPSGQWLDPGAGMSPSSSTGTRADSPPAVRRTVNAGTGCN